MPTPDFMRQTVLRYLECVSKNRVDEVLQLLADNISVEDPVGGPAGTHVLGIEAVSIFFTQGFSLNRPSPKRTSPVVTTAGNEAAVAFTLQIEIGGKLQELDVIDVMKFDEQNKISSLRAFWNYAERREVQD